MIPKWERRIKREKRHAVEKAIFYTFWKKKAITAVTKKFTWPYVRGWFLRFTFLTKFAEI